MERQTATPDTTLDLLDDVEDALRELGSVVIVKRYLNLVAPMMARVRTHRDALAANTSGAQGGRE